MDCHGTNGSIGDLSFRLAGPTCDHQPHCYGNKDWSVSAFNSTGALDPAWLKRLALILDEADRLGMVVIVQYFYNAQYGKIQPQYTNDAVTEMTRWLVQTGMKNVIIDLERAPEMSLPTVRQPTKHSDVEIVKERYRLFREMSLGGAFNKAGRSGTDRGEG